MKKPWSGRFSEPTDAFVERFTASIGFDQRLALHDIKGSLAHAQMLAQQSIISAQDLAAIESGLRQIVLEVKQGSLPWRVELEDVHMNIEARLVELVGDAGKRLHTARSRNDQVATDLRLYLRDQIDAIDEQLTQLLTALAQQAERDAELVMPGFTHLQIAQPITLGHHWLAWFEMLFRDATRFADCRDRLNHCPLGAAALAGTSYPIDRTYTARALDFDGICANSLDAVSDRDFAIEFCAAAALCMTHLSRCAEELILWNSPGFGYVQLPQRFCTGSSIMPQKRNPDVPELVRGKTGRVNGDLLALLTLVKAQPLAYNKDNQEDKEALFDAADTLLDCLRAFADMVPAIIPQAAQMRAAAGQAYSTATDLADYLVSRGLAFRDAHEVIGQLVTTCEQRGCLLTDLTLAEFKQFSELFEEDVQEYLSIDQAVARRDHPGGTAPNQVRAAAAIALQRIAARVDP